MCGIAAILGPSAAKDTISTMAFAQAHRGPDGIGFQHLRGADLGHARLAVLDVDGGAQPMSDPTNTYWIVFNGEIYNHRALRRELADSGYLFRTRSDTEVLLAAWRQWGQGALARLNGQFAFLIWDESLQEAFAARDRLGEKPLHFAADNHGRLLVASEIKGLLASGLLNPVLDREALECQLGCLYVPPGRTVYQNLLSLAPGEAFIWKCGQLERWVWWRPSLSAGKRMTFTDAAHELRHRLETAVDRQLVADVPVGAFLSGGLDSSSLVALAAERTKASLLTFSAGFRDLIDELPYAKTLACRYGTDHHECQMDLNIGDMLSHMASVYDEPFADSSNIPTYALAALARSKVKVVLSGDGGDELFGGYAWYIPLFDEKTHADSDALAYALAWGAWRVIGALCRAGLDLLDRKTQLEERLRDLRRQKAVRDPWRRHLLRSTALGVDRSLLWGGQTPRHSVIIDSFRPPSNLGAIDQAVHFDLCSYLPGDILVKLDRAAMAHGLETRAPFLDVELLEWVLGLPADIRFGNGKPLLKAALADMLPQVILERKKQGFGAPIAAWLGLPDIQTLWHRVSRRDGPLSILLPGLQENLPSFSGQAKWSLLCLGLWLEQRPSLLPART